MGYKNIIIPCEFSSIEWPSMDNVAIYILIDNITNEICYVGQSVNPLKRFNQHISRPYHLTQKNIPLFYWLLTLHELDTYPIMKIVNVVRWGFEKKEEIKTIKEYWKNNHPLLNRERFLMSTKNNDERVARINNSIWTSRMNNLLHSSGKEYTFR